MKNITVLLIVYLLLHIPKLTIAQPPSIDIYTDSVINSTNPLLFGTGDEIIQNFVEPDLDSMLTILASPLIRFGGISAEYFDWEADGYSGEYYIDYDDTVITILQTPFGIDSMLTMCERNNLEPIMTVNYHVNDPGKAARLVEYCNGDSTTVMGAIRASNGHPQPYGVIYWCIGNEVHTAQWPISTAYVEDFLLHRHFGIPFASWSKTDTSFVTPGAYDTLVNNYIDSMRPKSPIPIEIGISVGGDFSWFEPALSNNSNKIDWVDTHMYTCWAYNSDTINYEKCYAQLDTGYFSMGVEAWYEFVVDTVKQMANDSLLPVYLTEYNSGAFLNDSNDVWNNYLNGIFLADAIGHFLNAGVPISATYNTYAKPLQNNGLALIKGDTISFRTGAHVLKAYTDHFEDFVLKSNSNTFGLNVYGSKNTSNEISLFVINKDLFSGYTTNINIPGYIYDSVIVLQIQNDTTFAEPFNGTQGLLSIDTLGFTTDSLNYNFPKSSLTILKFSGASAGNVQDEEIEKKWVTVFPNPTTGIVNFKITNPNAASIEIVDVIGKVIVTAKVTSELTQMNLNNFTQGSYFYHIKDGSGMIILTEQLVLTK